MTDLLNLLTESWGFAILLALGLVLGTLTWYAGARQEPAVGVEKWLPAFAGLVTVGYLMLLVGYLFVHDAV